MSSRFRLSDHNPISFIATSDPARAKVFFGEKLGLPLIQEQLPFALVYDAHGIMLRVTVAKQVIPAPYTVLGWEVPDIVAATRALSASGIAFEQVPGLPQDEHGIWTAPGGDKVAWFKDPDGNTLSLSQHR